MLAVVSSTVMAGTPCTAPPADAHPSQVRARASKTFTQTAFDASRATTKVLPIESCATDGSPANTPPELESDVDSSDVSSIAPDMFRRAAVALLPEIENTKALFCSLAKPAWRGLATGKLVDVVKPVT
jgi:hypothetical protein